MLLLLVYGMRPSILRCTLMGVKNKYELFVGLTRKSRCDKMANVIQIWGRSVDGQIFMIVISHSYVWCSEFFLSVLAVKTVSCCWNLKIFFICKKANWKTFWPVQQRYTSNDRVWILFVCNWLFSNVVTGFILVFFSCGISKWIIHKAICIFSQVFNHFSQFLYVTLSSYFSHFSSRKHTVL